MFAMRALMLAVALLPAAVQAQAFPVKAVRLVVPLEPGGAVDIAARMISGKTGENLGQPIIVENRGGAAGQIGTAAVAKSPPDGYTILLTIGGAHVISQYTYKSLPYDPIKDFTPITAVADTILGISASASFAPSTLREMIEHAKRNAGKVSYGHTGVGGVTHLSMEQIASLTGIKFINVPLKGGGPLTQNMAGGQIDMGALPLAPVLAQVKAGKVKVLAILGNKRFAGRPDIPTVGETVPGFQMLEGTGTWVFGPAGMQPAVVNRLQDAIAKAVHSPEVKGKLEAGGQMANGMTAAELAVQVKTVSELGARLIKAAGVEPE
jgi:tripartite-type tricarboxylate transporter receptor subunit TctC